MDSKEWFKSAKFGFMSHFGLYSVLDGVYRGKPCNEWVRRNFRIPMEEYHALAKAFNPVYFSADEWVKTAKDAGMNYMVLTAKHHEGFATIFIRERDALNARGVNYLLNVGPDHLGRLPGEAVEILSEVGRRSRGEQ